MRGAGPLICLTCRTNLYTVHAVQILNLPAFSDERGLFVKPFNDSNLKGYGIDFTVRESYYSISRAGVIRGMHFQLPPHQHAKIVFCTQGAILDVALDLRKESPTYGQCFSEVLSAENHKAFYIPEGFAHGFKALTEDALTYYFVSSEYDRDSDTGIAYDSIGFDWDIAAPVLSQRDRSFINLGDFVSPF
jgi:dTDP-4-dehydrorhamnose 3,5-epimerase/CDP-3, 6-dideoxy-D-glycero-D-glycero-4-hexulose-5-epimerase